MKGAEYIVFDFGLDSNGSRNFEGGATAEDYVLALSFIANAHHDS